jgi:PAS domain S-box-containing protein
MAADVSADFRWVLDNLPDGVLFMDREWRITYANALGSKISRLHPEDLNGPTHWELFPAAVGSEQERRYRRVMEQRVTEELEFFYPPFQVWIHLRAVPISSGIAVIFRDVTELHQAQDEAAKLTAQLQQVFEATSDGVAVLNQEWRYTYLNRRAQEILEGDGRKMLDQSLWNMFPEAVYEGSPFVENFYRTMNDRVATAFEAYYPEPFCRWFRLEAQPAADGVVLFFRDITRSKQYEAALLAEKAETERQKAELEAVYRTAPVGLALFDAKEFRYLRVNDRQSEIVGMRPEELLGKRIEDVVVAPAVPNLFRERVSKGETIRDMLYETELRTRPGEVRSFNVNYSPIMDEAGEVRAISAAVLEVTQLRKAEKALVQSEKLAAVGRLASSISHEINNPLEAVTNLLYLVQAVGGLPEEARSYLSLAQDELVRVSQIATQTLRFHRQANKPSRVTAAQLVDAVLNLFAGRLLNSGIHVEAAYSTAARVLCFENDIRQVLNNLISNSIDAMRTGGRLLVRAHNAVNPETGEVGVRITVADTGIGMSSMTQRRLFEPFFTTKELNGNGLGLWISRQIVDRHRGRLTLRSAEMQGTVFALFLPCESAELQA